MIHNNSEFMDVQGQGSQQPLGLGMGPSILHSVQVEHQHSSDQKKTIGSIVDSIEFTKKRPKKGQSQTDSISSNQSIEHKQKSKIWTAQQLQQFTLLIKKYGTDFHMLSAFFPKKTKTQLKNRYKMMHNQEKKNAKQEAQKLQALSILFKQEDQQMQDN